MSATSPVWTSYWTVAPYAGELRREPARPRLPGEVLVRTLVSGISRGTEMLVYTGQVPDSVAPQMRAPFQEGDLPGPVKYGYLAVGEVVDGPAELLGHRVFCLHPHQDWFVVPRASVTPVPDDVPSARAVLAGTVETAINAAWQAGPRVGDRVAVIGAGMVGASLARLLRGLPLDRLQLIDIDPSRADLAAALDVDLVPPEEASGDCDLVFHCSASEAGLATGLHLLGEEAELVELSWYGSHSPQVPLGADFHARRLRITASQVGVVAAPRRSRRTTGDRLALALRCLRDPAYDALLTGSSPFADLPATMAALAAGEHPGLCHVITYPGGD